MKTLKYLLPYSIVLSATFTSFTVSATTTDTFIEPRGVYSLFVEAASIHQWCVDKGYTWGAAQSYYMTDSSQTFAYYNGTTWGASSSGPNIPPYYGHVPIVDVAECFK